MDEAVNKNEEPIIKIHPNFDFIYELGMPTGRKIKNTIILLLIFILGFVIFIFNKDKVNITNVNGLDFKNIFFWAFVIAIIVAFVKLIVHLVMKKMQYENITYTFFEDHMCYEDSFLNQHKKNIKYSNIKEVEIRRSVWDRILGYGIIVIYTNAENEYSNGLIVYGIKNPQKYYDTIESMVHKYQDEKSNDNSSDGGNSEEITENNNLKEN